MKESQPALASSPRVSSSGARAISLVPPTYGIGRVDAVQREGARGLAFEDPERIRSAALQGISGASEPLPHMDRIASSFGRFDVSKIVAHTDSAARAGTRAMGATGFAMGNHVAFAGRPSLHTAAHEAAHVVQQRAGVQLAGGVGQVGDVYEQHADAVAEQVVQGRSAEALLGQLAGPGPSGTPPIQRNVMLDIAGEAAGNFAWSYMQTLIEEHKVPSSLAALLEKACLGLIDYGIRVTGVGAYLAVMNPYVEVLRGIKAAILSIPEPIRVLLTYGIGYGIRKFSNAYMYGAITEAHINGLLIEGVSFVSMLGNVIEFFYDVGNNPASAVYKAVWAGVGALGLTKASSFGELLIADVSKPVKEADEAPAKPMVDAELGWFWLQAESPEIARWKEKEVDRGGLQLLGRFGIKVFGNVMGADAVRLRVPYAGDWEATFTGVSLVSTPITLGGIFKGGPITLNKVRIGHDGLRFLYLVIDEFEFGDGVFKGSELSMSYRALGDNSVLRFRGDTTLDAFGYEVDGKFNLEVDTDGNFLGGGVELMAPESFTLVEDRLVLSNPRLWAKWIAGKTDIGIGGDLQITLIDALDFASTGTTIQYTSDKGFVGKVAKIWLNLPIHKGGTLRFELLEGVIDSEGFTAGKISLIYAYGEQDIAKNKDLSKPSGTSLPDSGTELSKSKIDSIIPGFDMAWIKTTGLETLVVNLSATDLAIGAKGIDVGELTKEVTKFKARLFGVGAEFDGVARTGKIDGSFEYKVPIPTIEAKFPVIPGLHAQFGIRTDIGFGATLAASLAREAADESTPTIHPWKLGGKAGLTATAGVQLEAGVGVGIPYLAEVSGSLFARAEGSVGVDANVAGKVLWNDETHELSLPAKAEDKPSAELVGKVAMKANIGAQVRAQLFYFFDAELWSYRFVEWDLGNWSLSAKLAANAQGGYEVTTTKVGFGGDKGQPTSEPIVEKARVTAAAVIEECTEKRKKIEDAHQIWRLVHELQDPGAQMDREDKLCYFAMLEAINGTGEDLDAITAQVLRYVSQRSDIDGFSLLMSHPEWLAYSTTGKTFQAATTERKSIKPIDDAVAAYHKATVVSERKAILNKLINVLVPAYTKQSWVSRKEMAEKLSTDARRELARIS